MAGDNTIQLTRRKALGGLAIIGATGAGAGVGTLSYFFDEESSDDNTISSGTVELDLRDPGNSTGNAVWTLEGAKPGDEIEGQLLIDNRGSLDADHVELEFEFDETKEYMTRNFEIYDMEYPYAENLLNGLADENGNGVKDLDDLTDPGNADVLDNLEAPHSSDDPDSIGGSHTLNMKFRWRKEEDNDGSYENDDFQGEKFTMEITARMNQHESQNI